MTIPADTGALAIGRAFALRTSPPMRASRTPLFERPVRRLTDGLATCA